MTTATAEPTEQTTEQDTIDQSRGQQLLNSFTGMTDEQQTELFAAVKRIEGGGQAVEPETETKPTGTPEPMPLDKAHGELVDALYGALGDLRRSMERFGAARTILCEPDNTPMSWQDICAVNYTLDGFVQQMEALDEFITAVIGSPAGERRWRADARAADPFRRPAQDGQATTDDLLARADELLRERGEEYRRDFFRSVIRRLGGAREGEGAVSAASLIVRAHDAYHLVDVAHALAIEQEPATFDQIRSALNGARTMLDGLGDDIDTLTCRRATEGKPAERTEEYSVAPHDLARRALDRLSPVPPAIMAKAEKDALDWERKGLAGVVATLAETLVTDYADDENFDPIAGARIIETIPVAWLEKHFADATAEKAVA